MGLRCIFFGTPCIICYYKSGQNGQINGNVSALIETGKGSKKSKLQGFSRELVLEKIIGATKDPDVTKDDHGVLYFWIKWKGLNQAELVLAEEAYKQIPQDVIKFFESMRRGDKVCIPVCASQHVKTEKKEKNELEDKKEVLKNKSFFFKFFEAKNKEKHQEMNVKKEGEDESVVADESDGEDL